MDGFLFGYLRRDAIERRKELRNRINSEIQIEQLVAQRDALIEIIKTVVPDQKFRRSFVNPLYHKILRRECQKRNVPFPRFES